MHKPNKKPLAAGTAKGHKEGKPSMYMRVFSSMADDAAQPSAKGVRA